MWNVRLTQTGHIWLQLPRPCPVASGDPSKRECVKYVRTKYKHSICHDIAEITSVSGGVITLVENIQRAYSFDHRKKIGSALHKHAAQEHADKDPDSILRCRLTTIEIPSEDIRHWESQHWSSFYWISPRIYHRPPFAAKLITTGGAEFSDWSSWVCFYTHGLSEIMGK